MRKFYHLFPVDRKARGLSEPLSVLEIHPEKSVRVSHRNGRPILVEIPLQADDLFLRTVEVGYVCKGNVFRNLLLQGQTSLGQIVHTSHSRIDLHPAGSKEPLEPVRELVGQRLAEQSAASGESRGVRILPGREVAGGRGIATDRE